MPNLQREAAYALGATRWAVLRIAVLSYARRGLFGAAVLGLGRALGETMAVTMVIGNRPEISASLFAPGYTLASVIANEFTEATAHVYLSSLFELGLVLLAVTVLVNAAAQVMLKSMDGWRGGALRKKVIEAVTCPPNSSPTLVIRMTARTTTGASSRTC